ncbi:MAG: hypothetical protein ACD_20C00147G0011 [uncultured bacterium]|nr:MAG: hypothetical protein ACD_20C00147G0011 [uncultured bacterium]
MVRGIDIAATGMVSLTHYHDIIANNLANINTPGFKQTLASFKNLENLEVSKIDAAQGFKNNESPGIVSAGSVLDSTTFDFRQGSVKATGNPLDLAIQGDGFFVVRTPDGDAYTRNGNFIKSEDGSITTLDGYPVLGESGNPLSVNSNNFDPKKLKILSNGDLEINKEIVDKVKVVDFNDRSQLKTLGNSLFKPVNEDNVKDAENYQITQGSLESSNANVIESMIKSIEAMRAYEVLTKNIETVTRGINKTVNEVGRIKR